jgi:hypothetical protein
MYQSYPSSGQPGGPLRPAAPAPVLAAVRLMYAAAAVITVTLIISATLIDSTKASLRKANPGLTAPQVRDLTTLITLAIISGLALIALWLWMARANGQGKNWARILSTALFSLATLELIRQYPGSHLGHFVLGGQAQPVIHYGSGVTVLALIVPMLTWLAGAAAVWLLWRPASSAFFKPQGFMQAGPSA